MIRPRPVGKGNFGCDLRATAWRRPPMWTRRRNRGRENKQEHEGIRCRLCATFSYIIIWGVLSSRRQAGEGNFGRCSRHWKTTGGVGRRPFRTPKVATTAGDEDADPTLGTRASGGGGCSARVSEDWGRVCAMATMLTTTRGGRTGFLGRAAPTRVRARRRASWRLRRRFFRYSDGCGARHSSAEPRDWRLRRARRRGRSPRRASRPSAAGAGAAAFRWSRRWTCVEIKILRRARAESSRRPPRHRRDACSIGGGVGSSQRWTPGSG